MFWIFQMFESEFHECNNRKCTPSCLHTKNSSLKMGKGNNVPFEFCFHVLRIIFLQNTRNDCVQWLKYIFKFISYIGHVVIFFNWLKGGQIPSSATVPDNWLSSQLKPRPCSFFQTQLQAETLSKKRKTYQSITDQNIWFYV